MTFFYHSCGRIAHGTESLQKQMCLCWTQPFCDERREVQGASSQFSESWLKSLNAESSVSQMRAHLIGRRYIRICYKYTYIKSQNFKKLFSLKVRTRNMTTEDP